MPRASWRGTANAFRLTAVLVTGITHNCQRHTPDHAHRLYIQTQAAFVSSNTEVMQRGLSSLLSARLLHFACVFVCVVHRLLSRRLTPTLSLRFHTQTCENIVCWIQTVGFAVFPHFTLSLCSPFLAQFPSFSFLSFFPFHLSAPPVVSVLMVWLIAHKVCSGGFELSLVTLVTDLQRVATSLSCRGSP